MTNYKEVWSRCEHCPQLDKCADALDNVIWTTHIPIPEGINCEHFPELGEAIKEYVQGKIYELFMKEMENNQ